jgi:PAS domain S-box-containing protein
MSERRRILLLLCLMAVCCVVVGAVLMGMLYNAALNQQEDRLVGIAQSRARIMEAVAEHDALHGRTDHQKQSKDAALAATLEQFRTAHRRFKGFGRTGEFTLARRRGNSIEFLLRHRHKNLSADNRIPFDSDLAEPMQRALEGKSGTVVGKDYRGAIVLAAHEPVHMPGQDLGIVVKIDLAEVRAPFVRAGLMGAGVCLAVVLLGGVLFLRISSPVLRKLEQYAQDLENEIEERKAQQEQLAESEERYRSIFEAAAAMITSVNAQGVIVDCNARVKSVLGYERGELIGQPMGKIIHLDSMPKAEEALNVILSTGSSQNKEYRMVRQDGRAIEVSINSSGMGRTHDGFECTICIIEDITERKQAERAVRDSEARFRELTQSLRDIFFAVDKSLHITYWNTAAHAFTGAAPDQALGRHVRELFAPDTSLSDDILYSQVFETLEAKRIATQYKDRTLDVSVYPSSHGLSVFARDVTAQIQIDKERRKYREQLQQSQKMEAVGQLAGGMAHDFNNMLTIILSNAELALMSLPAGHKVSEELNEILRACERSRDLTMQLLTFARKEKINVRTVPIARLIDELMAMLNRSLDKKINIKKILNHDLAVRVDANQIQQALLNVCNNAADAMAQGGDLTIECSDVQFEREICQTCGKPLKPRYCQIQISDTGPGIPTELIKKVVEPFFTTKQVGKGTGLGLPVSLGIIENHDGHMHIYSEPGRGTCVRIYIPFADQAAGAVEAEPDLAHLNGTETILVVDDEERVLASAERLLQSAGYTPLAASGGAQALQLYEKRKDSIAIVLLDLIMPGMDGSEVFREIKRQNPGAKIILCSGYSVNGQAGELMNLGVDGFLQKPFTTQSLLSAIRGVIGPSTGV